MFSISNGMKTKIYKADDRGETKTSWLKSFHSFSFGNYYDEEKMGEGALRVLNDDTIKPNSGFPAHSHRDMEIVTIMLKGKLTHEDSLGNKENIKEDEVQVMSAGNGVTHSEYNNEKEGEVELLQIWITPNERNLKPRYKQKVFQGHQRENKWQVIVSPKEKVSLHIAQNAYFSLTTLNIDSKIFYRLHNENNGVYVFVIEGNIQIESIILNRRDAIFVTETNEFIIERKEKTEKSLVLAIEVPLLS